MKAFLKDRIQEEAGQSMILFAVLGSVLMMIMGLAIEGGNLFTQYRHMQSAADMAALVGAQDLPCNVNDSLLASCKQIAETDACNYAANNGYPNCSPEGSNAPAAYVPPRSCSPYDFIDYGNGSTNASCKTGTTPIQYYYIEVQLAQTAFTVPIFNVSVNLYAHAVARRHVPTPGDYALITLSPGPGALSVGGSSTVEIGGSVFSNGSISVNGAAGTFTTCDGGWNTAATETPPSQLQSDVTGSQSFAPAQCTGGTTGNIDFSSQQQQIIDPYSGSQPPPNSMSHDGWWYSWGSNRASGTWRDGVTNPPSLTNGNNAELFPGKYASIDIHNGGTIYYNPGVYDITGSFTSRGGAMCLYGAPACDQGESPATPASALSSNSEDCSTASFTTIASGTFYYYCSAWGTWDSALLSAHPAPVGATISEEYFYNGATGSTTTTPLNGVTFYMDGASADLNGNGYNQYLAAPNGCPGTGTQTGTQIQWNQGASNGTYAYPSGSLPYFDNGNATLSSTTTPTSPIYPSADWSNNGECQNGYEAWQGEFPTPQHLEALFWSNSTTSTFTFNGGGKQNLWGILYNPNSSVTVTGNGGGNGGPPWLYGQTVASTGTVNGNGGVTIDYRPCVGGATPCVTGNGTSLIE